MITSWEYTTEHIAAKTFFPVTSNNVSSNVTDSPFFVVYWILWEIVGHELRYIEEQTHRKRRGLFPSGVVNTTHNF